MAAITGSGGLTFQKSIEALCTRLADYSLFAALPGAGPVFAPRLMAAFGTDRERYRSAEDLQKYAGIAPVTERSGKSSWVHWRYACPTFLLQSFIGWAGQSIHHSFWAGGYYRY
ncbi:MAG: IS110 family transposase, partial [Gammaproteobacteria bacterium]|nr:IS110 family transposase [Gammaproteobacteria bacterium]